MQPLEMLICIYTLPVALHQLGEWSKKEGEVVESESLVGGRHNSLGTCDSPRWNSTSDS